MFRYIQNNNISAKRAGWAMRFIAGTFMITVAYKSVIKNSEKNRFWQEKAGAGPGDGDTLTPTLASYKRMIVYTPPSLMNEVSPPHGRPGDVELCSAQAAVAARTAAAARPSHMTTHACCARGASCSARN